jgi:glycosyltransferase involved in cell wall biosynthesis
VEVLVVDNGSRDSSAEIARAHGARVVHEPVRGYGAALRRGFSEARTSVIVMVDADLTYALDRVVDLSAPVLAGQADLVVGTRVVCSARSMPLTHRFIGTPLLTWAVRRAGGARVRDSQSGFRAFDARAVGRLGLRSSGMELASEMLILAGLAGLRVTEIDTDYAGRVGPSKLHPLRDGLRHLAAIARLAARRRECPPVPSLVVNPADG